MQINQNNYTTTKTTTSISLGSNNFQHRPFIPVQIKSEPIDYEILSDITIDTNTETDDGIFNNRNCGGTCTAFSNNFNSESTQSPHSVHVPSQSMVRLNDNNFLRSTTTSDMDFMKNYLRSSTLINDEHSSIDSMAISPTISDTATLVVANVKSTTKLAQSNGSTQPNKTNERGHSPDRNKENDKKAKLTTAISNADDNAPKKSKLEKIPYSILRLMPDGLKLLADRHDIKSRRRNTDKLLKIAVTGRLRSNLKEKVINPANRLRRKINKEKEKIIQRQASNRLRNTSDASGKLSVDEKRATHTKVAQPLKVTRQRVAKNKRHLDCDMKLENDIKIESGRITRNIKRLKREKIVKMEARRQISISNNDLFSFPSLRSSSTSGAVTKSMMAQPVNATSIQL